MGLGTLMAKMDLKEAYRNIPVHLADQHLLAVKWNGITFLDGALPFGLRSTPKLFSAVVDGLLLIFFNHGIQPALHYLDDFMFLEPPGKSVCRSSIQKVLQLCNELGVPVAVEKNEGPATTITFLGIEIDSQAGRLRLPRDKPSDLIITLKSWRRPNRPYTTKRKGTKGYLLSLIGKLHHACRVVKPERAFIRSLIDTSMSVALLDHYAPLGAEARADIAWWNSFVSIWNGVSIISPTFFSATCNSDASGIWGCGAVCHSHWFQLAWPPSWNGIPIAPIELVTIVVAVALSEPWWRGQKILRHCDNIAVVFAVNRGSARDPKLMKLLSVKHIPGIENTAADALSCNNLHVFFASTTQAQPVPSGVPQC